MSRRASALRVVRYQALCGLAALLVVACAATEPVPAPTPKGVRAVAALMSLRGPAQGSACTDGIAGTATFTARDQGIDLRLETSGCDTEVVAGYAVRLERGESCAQVGAANASSPVHVASLWCDTPCGLATLHHEHPTSDSQRWTLGGPDESNLLGQLLVLYDTRDDQPVACGRIESGPPAVQVAEGEGPPALLQAELAGFCPWLLIVGGRPDCPDPVGYARCARERCDVADCFEACAGHLACLEAEPDACLASGVCAMSTACAECVRPLSRCVLNLCQDEVACGADLAPDGPCSRVEACCMTQGDYAPRCLELLGQVAVLSGDPTCLGLINDWDWNQHLPVPCTYE